MSAEDARRKRIRIEIADDAPERTRQVAEALGALARRLLDAEDFTMTETSDIRESAGPGGVISRYIHGVTLAFDIRNSPEAMGRSATYAGMQKPDRGERHSGQAAHIEASDSP